MSASNKRGFTLLELLIVITILVILSVAVVLVLNPAETLKKARDAQRISDLSTLKTALGILVTSSSSPQLAGSSNAACKSGSGGGSYVAGDRIYYSISSSSVITDSTLDGGSSGTPSSSQVAADKIGNVDGNGWVPINLDGLTGGSPISNMPVDPTNSIASFATVVSSDLVYRYACNASSTTFEFNATLESEAFTSEDDKRIKDGGNNSAYYEVGTNLKILGTGTDF